jgi:hypothetical protein
MNLLSAVPVQSPLQKVQNSHTGIVDDWITLQLYAFKIIF